MFLFVISFNGKKVSKKICGYFVDKAINKLTLYNIRKGENVLSVKMPYYRRGGGYEYFTKDFGILKSPVITLYK